MAWTRLWFTLCAICVGVECVSRQFVATVPIRVGVHKPLINYAETPQKFLDQMNDNTFYNFSASFIDDNQITATGLANFDVILLAFSGNDQDSNTLSTQAASALTQWVHNGGGLVTAAFVNIGITTAATVQALQPVVPFTFSSNYGFCNLKSNTQLLVTNTTHPVVAGLGQTGLPVDSWVAWSALGINNAFPVSSIANIIGSNCTSLDNNTMLQGILVGTPANGRVVHLSPVFVGLYLYNSQNLRFGLFDQVLENSLYWTAKAVPLCPSVICDNGGLCTGPNKCSCTIEWSGPTCQNLVCTTPCGGCYARNPACNCLANQKTGALDETCSSAGTNIFLSVMSLFAILMQLTA